MKGIIVNQNPAEFVFRVWNERTLAEAAALIDLDRTVRTREALLADPSPARDAELLLTTWGMPAFSREEIRAVFPKLRAVLYAAGSVQYFARPFLEEGIAVHSAWAANGVPVAEYTVSQIVLANKGFYQAQAIMRAEGRDAAARYFNGFPGTYEETKVGLIGVGMIGSMVAQKLHALCDVQVLAYDPFLSDEKAAALGVQRVPLETLFSECQTISNHLANLPQTVGMLHYGLFSRMKPNAAFINTGRGAQIVEDDLIRALREEPGRTAVLDVTFPEPPADGSPFYTLPNVFLTPHIAGSAGIEVVRMSRYMVGELRALLEGQPPKYAVTMKMLETMA